MSPKAQNGNCKNKIANTLNTSFSSSDTFFTVLYIHVFHLFKRLKTLIFHSFTLEELQSLMIYQKVAGLSYSFYT